MSGSLDRAIHTLEWFYGVNKEMIRDGEITDEELKEEVGVTMREFKDDLAELHRIRTEGYARPGYPRPQPTPDFFR